MKHEFEDAVVMLAELTIKLDQREKFFEYTVANLEVCRSYSGNIAFDMLIDESRPEKVYFYEVWRSAEAQQRYMTWRVETGELSKLLAFLDAPPKFTALKSVSAPA